MAVEAIDAAPPMRRNSRNFVIDILDAQDMPPVFVRAPYSISPKEEQEIVSLSRSNFFLKLRPS